MSSIFDWAFWKNYLWWHCSEEFAEYKDDWTTEDKMDALAYLKTVENFEFVYATKITFVFYRNLHKAAR